MLIKEVAKQFDVTTDTLRYYEKMKMIPNVNRTSGGIRDYQEEDLRWVELAICMRRAGLPIEVMVDYVSLYQKGDQTFYQRLELLEKQMEKLLIQKENINTTIKHLNRKITNYKKIEKNFSRGK
ncbi:MAG: MerR family transcriptional regulator [Erysipelotrichaceae bacterium]